jgi:hypothetical protein
MFLAVCSYQDLFDPTFVAEIGKYLHESVIVDVNIVENYRVVDLAAGFLDEFFHHDFLFLVLSILHT